MRFSITLACLLFFSGANLYAVTDVLALRADSLNIHENGFALHSLHWRFHIADDTDYSNPVIADSTWTIAKTMFGSTTKPKGWTGSGWFRLWLKVDESLTGKMLAFRIGQNGASEIYLDGKKIAGAGNIGKTKAETRSERTPFKVFPFMLTDRRPHLLTVRYVNYEPAFPEYVGFQLWVGSYGQLAAGALYGLKMNTFLLASIGAQLALVLLHLTLFAFYRRQRLNLYYSLFVFSTAAVLYLRYLTVGATDPYVQRLTADLFEAGIIVVAFLAGVFLYGVSYDRLPRKRIMCIALLGSLTMLYYFWPNSIHTGATASVVEIIYFMLVVTDGMYALIKAMFRRKPRIWLIGAGMFTVVIFYLFIGSDILGLMKGNNQLIAEWMSIGLLAMPVFFSIYLALDFAGINRSLTARLHEVQELSTLNLLQETEKNRILAEHAESLEQTVAERTREVRSQAEKLREMDILKSRFMVNLTHEFRTPLSLIIGPAGLLATKAANAAERKQGELIKQNAQQLLLLINQLLDLSKLEEGKMEIVSVETDILATAAAVLKPFAGDAAQKQITIDFKCAFSRLHGAIDAGKLIMILRNLLSNAVKFSLTGGKIIVNITIEKEPENTFLLLKIEDQGIGIVNTKLPYVFDRFYQADVSDSRLNEGSGIGLALTRELVELLGGKIFIESTESVGTTVQVRLPITNLQASIGNEHFSLLPNRKLMEEGEHDNFPDEGPLLLVIEDHDQLRQFISTALGAQFRILTAPDGEKGLRLAEKHIPDLVITDLMMPGMDGYEVCNKIKELELTSHIPVLMLTARSGTDSRTKGWEVGADAYLSKPFEVAELLALTEGLIRTRIQLQERYRREEAWKPAASSLPPKELHFMDKVRNIIEAQLDNERFSIDMLCDLVALSRAQLHRKLKSTTGHSPGDLIRMVRLQQALTFLKAGETTVAEVAYKVGFGNPASFSTSFSNYFGYAPSEVKNS
ncbi:response regulator [Mucilaginibacter pocheonensis]|uniref:histidine kinase n=1 Tax=Mucilaginibacter pocheonensis TaxID=398050 RepID=A0ABU1THC1_9SPHI|nr:response regulator [Mucilaginibacter pocheonensis]MDR6944773.1 signal transduction histidine kinase/DNA-binding response OmpR family regulator [Mucilaginibacter pocheonensis]